LKRARSYVAFIFYNIPQGKIFIRYPAVAGFRRGSMISKKAQSLTPYVAGEQLGGGFIKLNTNENPYPPSPQVLMAIKTFNTGRLRLYPDPECLRLREVIAGIEGVDTENVFVGNGSDEILAFAFLALFDNSVAMADVTYSFYPVYADLYGLEKRTVPVGADFSTDLDAFKRIQNISGGIVLANPNAPTSRSLPRGDIEKLVSGVKCNCVIDEAYIDFASRTKSLASAAPSYPNMLVVKTLSKSYSLAGLRCGYAVGNKELIDGLRRVKNCFNSYTLDSLTLAAAAAALGDREYFTAQVEKIKASRERIGTKLRLSGHTVLFSDANFLFVRHKSLDGLQCYKGLKERNVLVRHFNSSRTAPFVRVTVGGDKDMDEFIKQFNALAP
jgi:histidinol-phosphate aminotransferase